MLTYRDAYLTKFCNLEMEDAAYAAVDLLGTFADEWRDPLTIIKCYLLVCLENQADPEDLFTAKYATYSKEFEGLLAQARSATPDDAGNIPPIFSVPIGRS
jgi:hypothetical protein